jgi:type VI protein secretion system component Hcp
MGKMQRWIVGAVELLRHPSRASLKLLVPVALVLGAGAAVAVGSIPSSGGTITGCVNTLGLFNDQPVPPGSLRVIDPSATSTDPAVSACQDGETTLTWNQQGPQGPPGVPGASGANGQQGASGKDGKTGTLVGQTNFGITSSKTSKLFLRIKGISGSDQVKGNGGGFIALGSFAAGAEAATVGSASSSAGAGAGAGKATIQMFTFTKAIDSTSGALFKDLAQHRLISAIEVIVGHQSGKKLVQVASYELGNVVITSIQDTGKSGAGAERVSGTFTSLKGTVGSGKDSVPTTWNRVTNEPTLTPSG